MVSAMHTTSTAAVFLLSLSSLLAAQIKVESETVQRVTTQIVYRNSEPPVSYRINYGPLKWRNEYGGALEGAIGGQFRLARAPGRFDTNAALSRGHRSRPTLLPRDHAARPRPGS